MKSSLVEARHVDEVLWQLQRLLRTHMCSKPANVTFSPLVLPKNRRCWKIIIFWMQIMSHGWVWYGRDRGKFSHRAHTHRHISFRELTSICGFFRRRKRVGAEERHRTYKCRRVFRVRGICDNFMFVSAIISSSSRSLFSLSRSLQILLF